MTTHIIDVDGTLVDAYAWAYSRVSLATQIYLGRLISPVAYEKYVYNRSRAGLRDWSRRLREDAEWRAFGGALERAAAYAGRAPSRPTHAAAVIAQRIEPGDEVRIVTGSSDHTNTIAKLENVSIKYDTIEIGVPKRETAYWYTALKGIEHAIVYDDCIEALAAAAESWLSAGYGALDLVLVEAPQLVPVDLMRDAHVAEMIELGVYECIPGGVVRIERHEPIPSFVHEVIR